MRIETTIKALFRRFGLEIQWLKGANTEDAALRRLFEIAAPVAVIDVGANVGQYAGLLRRLGYRGRIVSFEALPSVYGELIRNAAGDPNWIVAPNVALGAQTGTAEMNVAANTVSSSLLQMLKSHLDAAPNSEYQGTVEVPIVRLDDPANLALLPSGNVLLKIDTQGYEREVLAGATGLLPRVAALQLEVSLVELYAGGPTIVQMICLLKDLGYELFNATPGFKDSRTGRMLQMEGFFVRSNLL